MAGRTIGFLEEVLPRRTAIIRTIPNTPAAIGHGITVAVANAAASQTARDAASALLGAVGPVEWVEVEDLMDVATAVSGRVRPMCSCWRKPWRRPAPPLEFPPNWPTGSRAPPFRALARCWR